MEFPNDFDQSIQRLRERLPPTTPLDHLLRKNVREGYEPLEPKLRKELADRYADQNERLADILPFSIADWSA